MNEDTRRLHLRFSMQRPEQKKAFEIISAIPTGRRMEYLCGLINRETQFMIWNGTSQAPSERRFQTIK